MPRSTLTILSLLVVVATACADQPRVAEPVAATSGSALASRTGLVPVSLVVTISNADSLGHAYNIRNDGQGVYTDGVQSVGAVIDQYGTFAFNTFTGSKGTATRWVTYDFSSPVDPNNTYRPNPSNSINYHFSTGPSAFSPFTPLQNLGVNGNPSTECIYMGNGIANSTSIWGVSFHKGNEDVSTSPTAFAFVTRTAISPGTWTITPVGSCSPNSNVASLRSNTGFLYGYYNLPFFFTLQAK